MPIYRKLYVKTVESLDLQEMPDDFTRLMWVLLPLGLDAEGRGYDNAAWIQSKIFPLREDINPKMILDAMSWFEMRGMVERYTVDGRKYFCIVNWAKYQGITNKETKSHLPASPLQTISLQSNSRVTPELVQSNSGAPAYAYESTYESTSAFESESNTPEYSEPEDEFSSMQHLVEKLTGYPAQPGDIPAIHEFVKQKVIEEDIRAALEFFKGKAAVARGAASLQKSVMYALGKRIQAVNAKSPNGKHSKDRTNPESYRSWQ